MVYCGGVYNIPVNGGIVPAKAYGQHYTPFDEVKCEICGKQVISYYSFLSLGSPFKCTGAEFFVGDECLGMCKERDA